MRTTVLLGAAFAMAMGGFAAADGIRPHEVSTSAILAPNDDPERPAWIPVAGSTNLLATGFEPGEGFVVAPINGQNGWTNFTINNNIPAVSDTNPFAGSQHLRNSKGPGANDTDNGAFSPDFGPQPAGSYTVSIEFASNDAGGADHMLVGQAPSQGFLSWRIHFDWLNRIMVLDDLGSGLVFVDTGHTWNPDGQYRNVTVELDYFADTIEYYYDGNHIYSSVAGVFAGASIEQVVLFSDNWYTPGGWGDWDDLEVTVVPPSDPIVAIEAGMCETTGTLTVELNLTGNGEDEIVGGQFFMLYDASRLDFVSAEPAPAPSPFTLEIYEFHAPGIIDYAVGVDHGQSGTTGDALVAVLTFDALQEDCDVADLVIFGPGDNKLSDGFGQPVFPTLLDLPVVTLDQTPPVLTNPPDVVLDCDDGPWYSGSGDCNGFCGGQAPSGCWCDAACAGFGDCCDGICNDCILPQCTAPATASDNCDTDPVVSFTDTIIPSPTCPQEFTIERTWIATDACGNTSAPQTQVIEIIDDTSPTASGVPNNMVVYSDAGICGAVVNWTPPTAIDNCTDVGDIVVTSTHDPGDLFPVGVTIISYSFTDECGNSAKVNFNVEVLPLSQMLVDISLQSVDSGPFTRCIEFELTESNGSVVSTATETLTFTNGQALATIEVPCGADGICVQARGPLHTLRSTGDLSIVGTDYVADGFIPLRGGDLNDDGVVDILDFGHYVVLFSTNPHPGADTDCATPGPHGDMTGDGIVFTADFTMIQINYLEADAVCPITLMAGRRGDFVSPIATPQPRRSITVRELEKMGLGHLAIADLNNDGVVDEQDVALFLSGVRPD